MKTAEIFLTRDLFLVVLCDLLCVFVLFAVLLRVGGPRVVLQAEVVTDSLSNRLLPILYQKL